MEKLSTCQMVSVCLGTPVPGHLHTRAPPFSDCKQALSNLGDLVHLVWSYWHQVPAEINGSVSVQLQETRTLWLCPFLVVFFFFAFFMLVCSLDASQFVLQIKSWLESAACHKCYRGLLKITKENKCKGLLHYLIHNKYQFICKFMSKKA